MSPRPAPARTWFASPPPAVAVEVTATRVTAVLLAEQGGVRTVAAHATEPLPPGLATPALNAANVHDERGLAAALAAVLQAVSPRARRVALVLPDSVAKVSLLRFEKVPARAQDLEQLIRWQVRKAVPFRIEDAQVAWQPGAAVPGGGREFLVTVARRDIVQAYERACEAAGAHAGLVDLATFNQINALLAAGDVPGDWLLVNAAADYASIAVVRGDAVVSFRNRANAADVDLVDLVHQTAMYHEDRLGGGSFSRALLAGTATLGAVEAADLQRALADRIGLAVQPLDFRPGAELRDRIAAGPDLLDTLAAPVGVLLRERLAGRPAGGRDAEVA